MTDPASSSRILTLVFTDLADSTALKTERGDQWVGDLIERHRTLVRGLAAESGGRIIDWAGDGCFLTFEVPSAAVTFALKLQLAHFEAPDLPGVRAGLHVGEVSERPGVEGDGGYARVEGLAVDLAARIAGLARPAQVLMSAAVDNSARQRIDRGLFRQPIRWQAYGDYVLKGFDEPMDIREVGIDGIAEFVAPVASEKAAPLAGKQPPWRRPALPIAVAFSIGLLVAMGYFVSSRALGPSVAPGADSTPPAAGEVANVSDFDGRPAIAVLPFDNLSPDPDQAFFADGLAEDLITRLSAWRAFPVIARNSSFQYRGGNLDLKRVSAELGVRYLVEGSVRRAGDQIRVAAQLIDAPSGEHVWADTYDREVTDVFVLQDEISSTIAASLVSDLMQAEGERAQQRGTENLEAWTLYQLGIEQFDRYTIEGFAEARSLFERAAARDPRFATALALLSLSAVAEVMLGQGGAEEEMVSAALASARRAVELDGRDPLAHAALGAAYLAAGDPKNALDWNQRAVDLNPSMPEAWIWFGWAQLLAGNPQVAITASERAQRLNPQQPMVWFYDTVASAYWEVGRYQAGLEAAQRLVAMRPAYSPGYAYIAMNAVALERLDDARAAIIEGRRIDPDLSLQLVQSYFGVLRPEVDARRNAALRLAGLE
jgi:adenylate cyclase